MQQFVLQLIRLLVEDKDAVRVDGLEQDGLTTLSIHAAPSDRGKLIGTHGRTARALRTILAAASMKLHHRYELNIEEEERGMRRTDESSLL